MGGEDLIKPWDELLAHWADPQQPLPPGAEELVNQLLMSKAKAVLKQMGLYEMTLQPGQIIPVKDVDAVLYVDAQTLREQEFWDGLK